MIQPEFLYKLKQLPADTPITANHIVAILDTVSSLIDKAAGIDFDSLPNSKLINEDMLADWLDESNSTLQKWRVKGGGPNYVRGPKSVRYSVGAVRDWIDSRTVKSTNESYSKGLSKLETTSRDVQFLESFEIELPLMVVNGLYTDFFKSIELETEPEGFEVVCITLDDALKKSTLPKDQKDKYANILESFDDFVYELTQDKNKYGDWKSRLNDCQRLGFLEFALVEDWELSKSIIHDFSSHNYIRDNLNLSLWFLKTIIKSNPESFESLNIESAIEELCTAGVDINAPLLIKNKKGLIIFNGSIAHLIADFGSSLFKFKNLEEIQSATLFGSLLIKLFDLGLNLDLVEKSSNLSAKQIADLADKQSKNGNSRFNFIHDNYQLNKYLNSSIGKSN